MHDELRQNLEQLPVGPPPVDSVADSAAVAEAWGVFLRFLDQTTPRLDLDLLAAQVHARIEDHGSQIASVPQNLAVDARRRRRWLAAATAAATAAALMLAVWLGSEPRRAEVVEADRPIAAPAVDRGAAADESLVDDEPTAELASDALSPWEDEMQDELAGVARLVAATEDSWRADVATSSDLWQRIEDLQADVDSGTL